MNEKQIQVTPLVLVVAVVLSGLAGASQVFAGPDSDIYIGQIAPPPAREDFQGERPDVRAVWIAGHHEWNSMRYVWLRGFYSYPPRENCQWVSYVITRQQAGYYYRAGYWSDPPQASFHKNTRVLVDQNGIRRPCL